MPGTSLSAVRPALQTPAELLAAGRPADAAEALAAVVADAPTYAAAYVLLGVAFDAAGQPAEALAAWHRAAFLVPRSPLVLRERQRLIDATRPPGAAPEPDDAVAEPAEVQPEAATPPDVADAPDAAWLEPGDAAEGADADEPVIETAPLDDFVFLDAGGPTLADASTDPDAFDPAGFDFSAFDADDDGESWLGTDAPDAPPTAGGDAGDTLFGGTATGDAPTADWDDQPEPEAVRFVLPDADAPAAPAPPDADESWAVFEDLPAAPAPPVPAASATDLLTPDGATAAPAAEDDWFVDAAFSTATPIFHEPLPDDPDALATEDAGWAKPDALAGDELVPVSSPDVSESEVPEPVVADAPAAGEPSGEDVAPPTASVFAEPPAGSVADELDLLIASLETAPRIRPDPAFDGPAVRVPTADAGEMASETLARIYAAQHQYVQAALVYETLAAREPERAEALLGQAAEMRARRP